MKKIYIISGIVALLLSAAVITGALVSCGKHSSKETNRTTTENSASDYIDITTDGAETNNGEETSSEKDDNETSSETNISIGIPIETTTSESDSEVSGDNITSGNTTESVTTGKNDTTTEKQTTTKKNNTTTTEKQTTTKKNNTTTEKQTTAKKEETTTSTPDRYMTKWGFEVYKYNYDQGGFGYYYISPMGNEYLYREEKFDSIDTSVYTYQTVKYSKRKPIEEVISEWEAANPIKRERDYPSSDLTDKGLKVSVGDMLNEKYEYISPDKFTVVNNDGEWVTIDFGRINSELENLKYNRADVDNFDDAFEELILLSMFTGEVINGTELLDRINNGENIVFDYVWEWVVLDNPKGVMYGVYPYKYMGSDFIFEANGKPRLISDEFYFRHFYYPDYYKLKVKLSYEQDPLAVFCDWQQIMEHWSLYYFKDSMPAFNDHY
ncbi:MAG: hypothetical protein E7266_08000 [Lachnospiraceae bacterium]|nr:hypothetical protein [Lachnospiraceae bacterium]